MESYLELKQYKWIIMVIAQFGLGIWWQAVFVECWTWITVCRTQVLCVYVGLYVHLISAEMSDAFVLKAHNNVFVLLRHNFSFFLFLFYLSCKQTKAF